VRKKRGMKCGGGCDFYGEQRPPVRGLGTAEIRVSPGLGAWSLPGAGWEPRRVGEADVDGDDERKERQKRAKTK